MRDVDLAQELSIYTRNALTAWGVVLTPKAVAKYFENNTAELLRVPNIGIKRRNELNAWLVKHGQQPIGD
jgi:hypothetical protein